MENHELIPQTSLWPVFLGLGLALLVAGVVYSLIISIIGLVVFIVALIGWLQENRTLTRIFSAHEDGPVEDAGDLEERSHE